MSNSIERMNAKFGFYTPAAVSQKVGVPADAGYHVLHELEKLDKKVSSLPISPNIQLAKNMFEKCISDVSNSLNQKPFTEPTNEESSSFRP